MDNTYNPPNFNETPYVISLGDIIPDEDAVAKFARVFKNKNDKVVILQAEGDEEKLANFDYICDINDIGKDELFNALFIVRLLDIVTQDNITDDENLEHKDNEG